MEVQHFHLFEHIWQVNVLVPFYFLSFYHKAYRNRVPEFLYMVKDAVGSEVCNALDWLIDAASVMLLIIAGIAIHAENIITRNADYIAKKNSRGKFTWVYIALPATVLAVLIGIATNA